MTPNSNDLTFRLRSCRDEEEKARQAFGKATDSRYKVLAECLGIVIELKEDRAAKLEFTELCAGEGLVFAKGSDLFLRVIGYVFKNDPTSQSKAKRSNRSSYAKVIRVAHTAGETAETFVEWIRSKGGIDAVKNNRPSKNKASHSNAAVPTDQPQAMTGSPNLRIPADHLPKDIAPSTGDYVVLLVRRTDDHDFDLVGHVTDPYCIRSVQNRTVLRGLDPEHVERSRLDAQTESTASPLAKLCKPLRLPDRRTSALARAAFAAGLISHEKKRRKKHAS